MKHAILLITLAVLVACNGTYAPETKQYTIIVHTYDKGSPWEDNSSLYCDSLNMASTKECIIWNGGHKATIKAEGYITVSTNSINKK